MDSGHCSIMRIRFCLYFVCLLCRFQEVLLLLQCNLSTNGEVLLKYSHCRNTIHSLPVVLCCLFRKYFAEARRK